MSGHKMFKFKELLLFFIIFFINSTESWNERCSNNELKNPVKCKINNSSLDCQKFNIKLDLQNAKQISGSRKFLNVTIPFPRSEILPQGCCVLHERIFRHNKSTSNVNCFIYSECGDLEKIRMRRNRNCICAIPELQYGWNHSCNTSDSAKNVKEFSIENVIGIDLSNSNWECQFYFEPQSNKKKILVSASNCANGQSVIERLNARLSLLKSLNNDCSCESGNCKKVDEKNFLVKNGSFTHIYENIKPGNYCIQLSPIPEYQYSPVYHYLQLDPYDVPEGLVITHPTVLHEDSSIVSDIKLWIGLISGLSAVVFIAFLFINKRRRGQNCPNLPPEDDVSSSPELSTIPMKNVFLINKNDFELHKDVVDSFNMILETLFCKVSCKSDKDINDMLKDRAWFINNKLDTCDKILVVHSEGAFYSFNNKSVERESMEDYFNEVMTVLANKVDDRFNYKKIINIRFSYTDHQYMLDTVTPCKHYVLPDHMEDLFCYIHELDPQQGKVLFERYNYNKYNIWQEFITKIQNMEQYLKQHSNIIKKNFFSEPNECQISNHSKNISSDDSIQQNIISGSEENLLFATSAFTHESSSSSSSMDTISSSLALTV